MNFAVGTMVRRILNTRMSRNMFLKPYKLCWMRLKFVEALQPSVKGLKSSLAETSTRSPHFLYSSESSVFSITRLSFAVCSYVFLGTLARWVTESIIKTRLGIGISHRFLGDSSVTGGHAVDYARGYRRPCSPHCVCYRSVCVQRPFLRVDPWPLVYL